MIVDSRLLIFDVSLKARASALAKLTSKIINHQSSIINHQSSIINQRQEKSHHSHLTHSPRLWVIRVSSQGIGIGVLKQPY